MHADNSLGQREGARVRGSRRQYEARRPQREGRLMNDVTDCGGGASHDAAAAQGSIGAEMLRPLRKLSNDELWRGLNFITFESRVLLARQIAFLAEAERRSLWSDFQCKSLHEFCHDHLRMSEYGAYRRIAAAKLALDFPIVLEKLENGDIHLSALLELRNHLTRDNHIELLEAARNKTKVEVENMIAKRFPRPGVLPRTSEAKTRSDERRPAGLSSPAFGGAQAPSAREKRTQADALSPGRHRFEFIASSELREKLEHARALMLGSNPEADLGTVVERAIDLLLGELEKEYFGKNTHTCEHSPAKTMGGGAENIDKTLAIGGAEHIAEPIRREVAERDDYRCTFVSDDGVRCGSQSSLQFDHVIPIARNGETSVANVRLRCKAHDILAAKGVAGRKLVQEKVARSRTKAPTTKDSIEVSPLPPRKPEEAARRSPPPDRTSGRRVTSIQVERPLEAMSAPESSPDRQ
jgi:hypothetical protein